MTDQIDLAQDHIERELAQRLEYARRAQQIHHTDTCVHCGDPARQGSRFCCKECLDENEHQARQLKRLGKL